MPLGAGDTAQWATSTSLQSSYPQHTHCGSPVDACKNADKVCNLSVSAPVEHLYLCTDTVKEALCMDERLFCRLMLN